MPKTIEETYGDKTFVIRKKIPLQLLDKVQNFGKDNKFIQRLNEIKDDPEAYNEYMTSLTGEQREQVMFHERKLSLLIARKMIIEPKITDEFLKAEDDGPDEDDLECWDALRERVTNRILKRFEDLKEKPSTGHASGPTPRGRFG